MMLMTGVASFHSGHDTILSLHVFSVSGPRLCVGEQLGDAALVSGTADGAFAQIAFLFRALAGQFVAAIRMMAFEFTGTGNFDPLSGTAMGLHFRHDTFLFFL